MRHTAPVDSPKLRKSSRKAKRQTDEALGAHAASDGATGQSQEAQAGSGLAALAELAAAAAHGDADAKHVLEGPLDGEFPSLDLSSPQDLASHGLAELPDFTWELTGHAHATWLLADARSASTAGAGVATDASAAAPWPWAGGSGGLSLGLPLVLGAIAAVGAGSSKATGTPHPPVERPVVTGITGNAATDTIALSFDKPLSASQLPLLSQFTVTQGGDTLAIAGISLSGDGLTLSVVVQGDLTANPFSIRYTDASSGDDTRALQTTTGVDVDTFQQGLVADGPIQSARIYVDRNRDGIAQDAEFTGVTTDRFGRYVLNGIQQNGPIIATGGVNVDTGVFNTMVLKAPEGSMVVNPVTTLVQSLVIQNGISPQQASSRLAQALGLDGLDLTQYDPLASGHTPTGLAVQKLAAQVATLVQTVAGNDSAASSAVIDALATHLITAPAPSNMAQPLLAQADLIQVLFTAAQVPLAQQASLLTELQDTVNLIDNADSVADISEVQASTGLDDTPPAAPKIKMIVPTALGEMPEVVVSLNTDNSAGRGALAGHVLTVTLADQTYTHVLTQEEVNQGWAAVQVAMDPDILNLSATLTDLAGNVSAPGRAAALGGDTFELGAQLAVPIQGMLQTLGNQELPLLGPLDEFASSIWGELQEWLSLIPTAQLKANTPATVRSGAPLAALDFSALTGDQDPSYSLVFDDSTSTGGDDSGLPPWLVPDGSGSNSGGGSTGGGSTGGGDTGGGSTGGGDTGGGGSGETPTRVLIGRNTGQQFEIADLTAAELKEKLYRAYSQDLEKGEFKFNLQLPFRIFQEDMLGEVGVDGAQARIDASFDSYGQLEINLEGKIDAKKYVVFDTSKSKLELTLDGGLKEGSQFALELGPLVVAASDLKSPRVASDAQRQNTGLHATVGAYLKDNDGKADQQVEMSPATIAKFFNQIAGGTFKIPDWYALKVDAYAQLSAQALGRADLQRLLPDPTALANSIKSSDAPESVKSIADTLGQVGDPIYSLLSMLSPQLSTKLLVPASFSYDSRLTDSAFKSEYGKVYFDDIQIGAQTLLSTYMEPGLNLLNTVMEPLYLVEDLVNAPLDWPESSDFFTRYTPPTSWPDWLEELASSVANAPADLTQDLLDSVQASLDRDRDGQITVFESLRSTVDNYQVAAMRVAQFWGSLQTVPGIKEILKSAGAAVLASTGVDVIAILSGLADTVTASVTRPLATAADPNPLSPMEKIQQALDAAEQVFQAIDQLQGLQALYDQAQADLQRLSANGDSNLGFSLGSYAWDIGNSSFAQTRNAYEKKQIDYSLPSSSAQVALLTQQEAIQIIFEQIKAGTASSTSLSPALFVQAGVDFDALADYNIQRLGSGVSQANFNAVCDILNNLKDKAFTKDKDWTDASLYSNGQLLLADSFTQDLTEIADYNRLWKIVTGRGDFLNLRGEAIADTLFAIGVIPAADRQVYEWVKDHYKWGDVSGNYILKDIFFQGLDAQDIDTYDELEKIWRTQKLIEDLTGNRTTMPIARGWEVDGPNYDEVAQFKLSFEDFARIGLPILSRNETVREAANYEIWDIPGLGWAQDTPYKFDRLYDEVAEIIRTENTRWLKENGANGNGAVDAVVQKFMVAADPNGSTSQISMADFQTLGLSDMQASMLPFLTSMLASDVIQSQDVNSVTKIGKLVAAVDTVFDTANDQAVEAKAFYSAIELLLGKIKLESLTRYPDTLNSYAEVLAYIPLANAGGINQLYSTEALPLFQSIIKRLDAVEVDSHAELRKLADITKDLLLTSMKAEIVWDTHGLVYTPTDMNDEIISAFKSYKSNLTVSDLHLLGYDSATSTTASAVQSALADFNKNVDSKKYTTWFGSSYKSFTTYEARATNLNKLDIAALDTLVGDYSESGFFTELLSLSPALTEFWENFRKAGFDLPFVSDEAFIQKLWTQQPLDLLTFKPNLPSLDTGNLELFNVDLIKATGLDSYLSGFSAPLKASFSATIQPRLAFGMDTGGLIEASQLPDDSELFSWDFMQALLNGFYVNDKYEMGGSLVDLPELAMDLNLDGLLGLNVGKVNSLFNGFAQLTSNINLNVNYDLDDANADLEGKVRMGDLFSLLFTDPMSIGDIGASLSTTLGVKAKAVLDLTPQDWGILDSSDNAVFKSLTEAVGDALDFLGWDTEYTLFNTDSEETVTWLDSDPNTDTPSLLEFIDQMRALAQNQAVI